MGDTAIGYRAGMIYQYSKSLHETHQHDIIEPPEQSLACGYRIAQFRGITTVQPYIKDSNVQLSHTVNELSLASPVIW